MKRAIIPFALATFISNAESQQYYDDRPIVTSLKTSSEAREYAASLSIKELRKEYYSIICTSKEQLPKYGTSEHQKMSEVIQHYHNRDDRSDANKQKYLTISTNSGAKQPTIGLLAAAMAEHLNEYPIPACAIDIEDFAQIQTKKMLHDPKSFFDKLKLIWPKGAKLPSSDRLNNKTKNLQEQFSIALNDGYLSAQDLLETSMKINDLGYNKMLPSSVELAQQIMIDVGINLQNTKIRDFIAKDLSFRTELITNLQKMQNSKSADNKPADFISPNRQ